MRRIGRRPVYTPARLPDSATSYGAGVRLFPFRLRYAWPAELDRMAERAGLRLRDRWSDWERQPFASDSGRHISVYEPHV